MKKYLVLGLFFLGVQSAVSALAPQYRNMEDLDVLVQYVQSHPRVASGLRLIDMKAFSIVYGAGCVVTFKRQQVKRPRGWVGPAAPLIFSNSTCGNR